MPSILAFFNDNKSAHNCMLDVKKNIKQSTRVYTVAQHEYKEATNDTHFAQVQAQKSRISTKVGGFLGLLIGVAFAVAVEVDLFSSMSTFAGILFIVIASAAAGSLIGLFVLSATDKLSKKNESFKEERGELILIVEKPGDDKDKIVSIIEKYKPDKIKVY